MSGSSTILPFASETTSASDVLPQGAYLADADRKKGHQPGVARRDLENKVLKQVSLIAAALGEFVAAEQDGDVNDTLTTNAISSMIKNAIKAVAPQPPAAQGDGFASGTILPFCMYSAPTGWTILTGDQFNNRMMVLSDQRGGSYGGYDPPSSHNKIPHHTHTFTTGTQSHTHTHRINLFYARSVRQGDGHYLSDGIVVPWMSSPGSHGTTTYTSYTENATHTHSGTTGDPNGQVGTWNARYIRVIMCRKV